MIAKIAVSAALFAIDKPYSYEIPPELTLEPGMRVLVPFGRGNRSCEGIVLQVEDAPAGKLKAVFRALDEKPVLSERQLRLAAALLERLVLEIADSAPTMRPRGRSCRSGFGSRRRRPTVSAASAATGAAPRHTMCRPTA